MQRLKLSKSSIDQFYRCPRAWYFKYVLGRVPISDGESVDLEFGKAFHDSIEKWAPQFSLWNLPDDEVIKGEALFYGYQQVYDKPLTGEHESKFELDCGPYDFVGVFDFVDHQNHFLRETKTTRSWINDDYWLSLPMQPQAILYPWALSVLHGSEWTLQWDVVQRCKLVWGKRESEDQYKQRVLDWIYSKRSELFQRRTYAPNELLTEEAPNIIGALAEHLDTLYTLGEGSATTENFPMNGNSCRAFGRLCGYAEVCRRDESIEADDVYKTR